MSSLTRRMQRMNKREGHKNPMRLGATLGIHNPKAKDLLARERREAARRGR
jgi:hypothetical protein